jgi:hypothetical protein
VKTQRIRGSALLLATCGVVACTRTRPADVPMNATPLPRAVVHETPTRRAWPTTARPESVPPDAAPAAIVDTLNGDPKGLKREDINGALQAALPALAGCFQGSNAPPSIGLAFDAEPDGRASNIHVTGATPDGERCVSATLGSVKLPVFEGRSVPVQFPISVYRPPTPPTPAQAIENPAPAVPVAGAAMPAAPPPGSSTAPYAPPTMPATAGSVPSADKVKVFIQP